MDITFPPIVGIGASAGGVSAVSQLLQAVPAQSGMAFVVVTHLNPDHESLLHTVLARQTDMAVKLVQDGDPVEPDTVHVMPEGCVLTIDGGHLRLATLDPGARERKPIDVFFSALAEDQKENVTAIVLSGYDGDGALGVKVVKEYGGVTFAQTPGDDPSLISEMPQSAIATGFVDFAIPVEDMPAKLIGIRDARAASDVLAMPGDPDSACKGQDAAETQSVISQILLARTGHDFSGYKDKTFFRRVARRMQVRQIARLDRYAALLESDTDEVNSLFRDLLISVTDFFRDGDAFAALSEKVIPSICENRDASNPIRVWVPACTTGEEVYSLAILISEHLDDNALSIPVQIFATDIDDPALGVARQGRYPEQLLRNVSPERLARYFTRDGASYVVSKKVREMCIFSPHNVISDPPFSRMDLVSCRNLLIYFGPDLQRRVIPTFHYALKPGGHLFLGTSESISQYGDLFNTIDKTHRIFESLEQTGHRWNPSDIVSRASGPVRSDPPKRSRPDGQLGQRVERHILEQHTPAHAVIRDDGTIVFISAGTGSLLELPRGLPSHHLLDMVPRDVRLELRSTLQKVVETRKTVARRNLSLTTTSGARQLINLTVEPLRGSGDRERLFIVFFQPVEEDRAEQVMAADTDQRIIAAEHELEELRERLQSTVEEYEAALEELKSSNEELVSVNEEAQSANEELEASKEEMQSLNEELHTINAELKSKIEELDLSNDDLRNMFEATQIATVFLDDNLVIRNFTPAAADLFGLREADLGRALTDLASVGQYPELSDHIGEVFATGTIYEHRLDSAEKRTHLLVRITPNLSDDRAVEGAVVTLVDITTLARAEEHQKVLIAELNHRVKNMLAVIVTIVKTSLRARGVERDILDTLTERLQGMARAYGLVSLRSWTTVGIRDIIEEEMAVFDHSRIRIHGPDVDLQPSQALAVNMTIHELFTNAAKYGALSNGTGTLDIAWSNGGGRLALQWRESGGPAVATPERNGFGYVLIQGQIEQQLEGRLEATYDPKGLSVEFDFPL